MKKFTILLAVLTVCMYSFAQTFVSTTPANKNVVLEEYTGTNCVYCPDGHRVAQQLVASNPDRIFAINIHQGGFSGNNPDYKTQWGDSLAFQTGLTGYPSGTINRHVFIDTTTALARNTWSTYSSTIMGQPSPVNVAAQSTIDWSTRTLTVVVEVYYTGNATNATNKLNVALLQNNVFGPQTGGSNFNPTMVIGANYRHMHMLRDLLTGQWGSEITNTTTGSFYTQTYNYTIPENFRNVPFNLEDVEVIAFVTEGRQEILTGCKSALTHINAPSINPMLYGQTYIGYLSCNGDAGSFIHFRNAGATDITSLEFTYTIAGGTPQTYFWDARTISSMAYDTIHLPLLTVVPATNQIISVNISQLNGSPYTLSTPSTMTINKKVIYGSGYMSFKLVTDQYGSETTFKFFRPDGTILLQGGPFTNLGSAGTTTRWFAVRPDQIGCYRLEVYDSYGDGINANYGVGGFQLIKYDNTILINDNGKYGSLARYMIDVDQVAGIEETITTNDVNVYPNPTDGVTNVAINLVNDAKVNVTVYNMYGQLVQVLNDSNFSQGANNLTFNASSLSSGIYLVKVTIDNETFTKKVTVR